MTEHRAPSTEHRPPSTEPGVCMTREQLAASLSMSYATLRRRIIAKNINMPARQLLSPADQRMIREALGYP